MPSADFRAAVRKPHDPLSPRSGTRRGPPEVSSAAFPAHPPNLQRRPLMDMDFAVACLLVRTTLPRIRFLSIGSRVCSTLPSDPALRRRPCASLALHLHQVVRGTSTPKLRIMLGTHADSEAPPPQFSFSLPSFRCFASECRTGCFAFKAIRNTFFLGGGGASAPAFPRRPWER